MRRQFFFPAINSDKFGAGKKTNTQTYIPSRSLFHMHMCLTENLRNVCGNIRFMILVTLDSFPLLEYSVVNQENLFLFLNRLTFFFTRFSLYYFNRFDDSFFFMSFPDKMARSQKKKKMSEKVNSNRNGQRKLLEE